MDFFEKFEIKLTFLDLNVLEWYSDQNYQTGLKIAKHLRVVNDVAERGIKLTSDLNHSLTAKEEQKQYVLQVVEYYNRMYEQAIKNFLKPMNCG